MSFAQLREAYILAGQRSFRRGGTVQTPELLAALNTMRAEVNDLANGVDGRSLGFGSMRVSGDRSFN
jgi:hypothetical protein